LVRLRDRETLELALDQALGDDPVRAGDDLTVDDESGVTPQAVPDRHQEAPERRGVDHVDMDPGPVAVDDPAYPVGDAGKVQGEVRGSAVLDSSRRMRFAEADLPKATSQCWQWANMVGAYVTTSTVTGRRRVPGERDDAVGIATSRS
jgi:hypothetical protein